MALESSGTMSIGGSTSGRSINLELGRAAGATSSLGETDLRDLAGVASGAISMSNFYGASAASNIDYYTGSEWSPGGISNPEAAFSSAVQGSGSNGGNFGPFTYTFATPVTGVTSARIRGSLGATSGQVGGTTNCIVVDGTDVTQKFKNANGFAGSNVWVDVTSEVGGTWNSFRVQGVSGSTNPNVSGVEVNGVQLISTDQT